jgi:hypothetical protein
MPVVADPRGSAALLRQIPNGLTPNSMSPFSAESRSETPLTSSSMLCRRQSPMSVKPSPYAAKVGAKISTFG